eukprot:TRINITY_DN55612_c0_g1_i1.p1 TRINITY_DN55612_c0_g1~~TRINITY_DN55612_c0_g1_i1.p1  ORF type:complete len:804 (+),score=156.03 TRINITY_DN55612_c0_g1_i1:66-2414(+)
MPSKRKRPLLRGSAQKKPAAKAQNPFEEQWNKIHRTTQRKKLQRAHTSPSTNRVLDNRIGENNPNLDDHSRYLFRLQRERAKRAKKNARFALDDDEHTPKHTELFPSLHEMDEPELSEGDQGSESEAVGSDDEKPFFSVKPDEAEHGEQPHSEYRTKREVMHEVIEKSKMFKTLRQHIKHQTDEQTAKLDEQLPQLVQLLSKSNSQPSPKKPTLSLKANVSKASIFDDENHKASTEEKREQSFRYEDVYRQLAQEKRAVPSERMLTEEETAKRQKEQLTNLEKLRNARMNNIHDDDNKDRKKATGDDLEDDFILHQSDSEESAESSDSDFDAENEEFDNVFQSGEGVSADSLLAVDGDGVQDIPFVYKKAPVNVTDLQNLFEGTTLQQRSLIMERLLKCFAISLNPGKNRPRLIRLSELLLQRISSLCRVSIRFAAAVSEIDMLIAHVHKLGFEQVVNAWGRRQVLQAYTSLVEGKGSLCERWGIYEVMILRAVGALFPASDARHPVSTPLQILLSESLSLERMKGVGDIALGVFIASVLLEMLAEAERYSPHIAMFAGEILRACAQTGRLSAVLKYSNESSDEALSLAEAARISSGTSFDEKLVTAKIVDAAICLAEELTFCGRVPHADLIFSQVLLEKLPNDIITRMKTICDRARRGRVPLQLYANRNNKPSFKLRNPRFSSENGVFRKRSRSSFEAVSKGDVSASAKRIRRALKKEERGLARDVRREAELHAAEMAAKERIVREDRDARDKAVRAFFETQRSTWRAAEKRQKKLSGKKW